jgi:thiol:disulfide interchange protein DsbD
MPGFSLPDPRGRLAAAFALGLAACGLLAPLQARAGTCTDSDDLMTVDEAFVVEASAPTPDAIRLAWRVAPGCYLYRHQIKVQAEAGFDAQPLQLPAGEPHQDQYFGRVETYRDRLVALLPGQASAATATVRVRYQGCADAGICYPPQTRTLTVPLAASASAPAFPNLFGRSAAAPAGRGLLPQAGAGKGAPLPAEQAFGFEAIVGDGNTLLLRFTPAPGYYLYRDKTRLGLDAAANRAGIRAGQPRWPRGTAYRDEHFGQVQVYFEPIDVAMPLLRTATGGAPVTLTASFQGCQTDGICYPPMTRTVALMLPAGTLTPVAAAGEPPTAPSDTPPATTAVAAPAGAGDPAGAVAASATPAGTPEQTGIVATPDASPASAVAPGSAAPHGSSLNFASALLLAVLGGLILNLMPCVLPVLSLKALSLAGNGEDPARARRHALWYTGGVMLSFALLGGLALALRQAGLALGWGFQLQQPLVVAVLALLMFGLGLSLSGIWHVGGRWTGAGHALTRQAGPAGDFFTGVLAVVVATPCTAPFMGVALAWAFTAPSATAMAVFLVLGLGMALPFLLIGFIPALAHRLPRPGAWMETFKQLLAFPLYLTAAWLAWVLGRQRGADAIGWWLLGAVLLAFAAWAWTRSRTTGRRRATVAAALAALALAWPLHAIHQLPRPEANAAPSVPASGVVPVAFTEARLAQLRAADRVVFVNVTADWCVTCKANERAVFARSGFREAMAEANAVYMVGDWTDVDPALTAFLQRYKAVGVPLYVVFPRGGGEGRTLPMVLTVDSVREALAHASEPAR